MSNSDDRITEAQYEELIRGFIDRISNDEAADLFSEIRTGIHVFGKGAPAETVCSSCFLFKDALAIARYCKPGHPEACGTKDSPNSPPLTFEEYKAILFKAEVAAAENHIR